MKIPDTATLIGETMWELIRTKYPINILDLYAGVKKALGRDLTDSEIDALCTRLACDQRWSVTQYPPDHFIPRDPADAADAPAYLKKKGGQ
jgi:hypothetical protein